MSRSGAFCPRCGDPVASDRPAGRTSRDAALCDACYLAEYDLVDAPDRIELTVCARCGAVERGAGWIDVGADDYVDIAVDAVQERLGVHADAEEISWEVAPERVDETTIRIHAGVAGRLRGRPVTEERTIAVKVGRGTCTRCGRIAGGSYASTIQLRAHDREPDDDERARAAEIATDLVEELEANGDREAFVTGIEDVPGGRDVRLSTTRLGDRVARRIVAELGGDYTTSETLVTEDEDGNELYRVTYAIRLPTYRPGAVVDPGDGDPILVRSAGDRLTGTRLSTGADYDGPVEDATRLTDREDAVETTLVAVPDAHAAQVLDPESYETVSVPRPSYLDPDADAVRVVRAAGQLYVLPPEPGRS